MVRPLIVSIAVTPVSARPAFPAVFWAVAADSRFAVHTNFLDLFLPLTKKKKVRAVTVYKVTSLLWFWVFCLLFVKPHWCERGSVCYFVGKLSMIVGITMQHQQPGGEAIPDGNDDSKPNIVPNPELVPRRNGTTPPSQVYVAAPPPTQPHPGMMGPLEQQFRQFGMQEHHNADPLAIHGNTDSSENNDTENNEGEEGEEGEEESVKLFVGQVGRAVSVVVSVTAGYTKLHTEIRRFGVFCVLAVLVSPNILLGDC